MNPNTNTFDYLILLVVLAGVVYRVTRLIVMDTIFEEARTWAVNKISPDFNWRAQAHASGTRLWRMKLADLVTCPYCASAYVSAGAVALTRAAQLIFHDGPTGIPMPVWTWLAAWAFGLVVYAIVDSE